VRHQQALCDGGSSNLPAQGSGGAALPVMAVKQRREREGRKRERGERVNRGLTQLDLNFCVETRKTVNIKVVGNSKIYNFCVGRNFI
jgi:hypothetical protein